MDQLKPAIEFFKKNGFWIAVALILLGSLGVWYTVTSDLVAESDARASKIKGDITKVSSVRGELATHPNPTSHQRMEAMIETRRSQVLDAWTNVYEKQKDILVWPEDLTDELKDEYRTKIPIEKYIEFPVPDDQKLEPFLLQQYRMYIDKTLPKIAKIADAEWTAKFDSQTSASGAMGSGMYGMDSGGMDNSSMMGGARRDVSITGVTKGPLVRWSSTAQQNLIAELFPWQGKRPTTLEVYYSQESLWILRQLLEIIATVNGEAKQPFEAKIREIKQLSMGRTVKFTEGVLASPARSGAMGMDGMMQMDMGMGMESGSMDMGMGMDSGMGMGMGMDVEAIDPADNRYVTPDHEPITGSALRAALESDTPEDAALKVAKRVPVMMSVRIDQRAVADLLAACGSAPLMVEVIQTRVFGSNEAPSASSYGGGAMSSGGMGGSGMGSGMSGGMDGMGGRGGMGGGYGAMGSDQFPLDVTVEVYGLIHVYNPPQKVSDDKVTAETVIDGETMAEKVESEKAGPATVTPNGTLPPPATTAPATTAPANVPPAETPAAPAPAVPAPAPPAPAADPTAADPTAADPTAPDAPAPAGPAPAGPAPDGSAPDAPAAPPAAPASENAGNPAPDPV